MTTKHTKIPDPPEPDEREGEEPTPDEGEPPAEPVYMLDDPKHVLHHLRFT